MNAGGPNAGSPAIPAERFGRALLRAVVGPWLERSIVTENAETGFIEQETRKRTFYGLDALRGIAAAVVVTRHAPALFGIGLFPNSSLGVDLFFVMSGFVIAHAYDQRIEKGLNWRQFLVIRAIRLYPLDLLGTALGRRQRRRRF